MLMSSSLKVPSLTPHPKKCVESSLLSVFLPLSILHRGFLQALEEPEPGHNLGLVLPLSEACLDPSHILRSSRTVTASSISFAPNDGMAGISQQVATHLQEA